MKKLTLGLILGSFFVFPVAQTQCWSNNKNSFNGNTDSFNEGDNTDSFNNNTNCCFSFSIGGFTIIGNRSANHTQGSGNRTTKTTPITGSPSKVDISFGSLTIKQGNEQSLVVKADDNIHQHLKQVISDASIELKTQGSFSTRNPVEYTLTLQNAPTDLRASGSSFITTQAMKTEQMKLILSGASKIYMPALQTKKLTADICGASKVTIDQGSVDNQKVICSGASVYNAAALKSLSTKAYISGASRAAVNAQQVTGKLSGASKLAIHGQPNNVDVSTSGASSWFFA